MRSLRMTMLGVLAGGLAACSPRFELPEGAEILCETVKECPPDHLCISGLCVLADGADTTLPTSPFLQPPPLRPARR